MKYYSNPNYQKKGWKIPGTSRTEIEHLFVAWIAISLAFSFVLNINGAGFIYRLFVSTVVVGTGFLLHELAHKFVAQKFGMWAEFRASYPMLGFALLFSAFLGVVVAAPGAVMIFGHATRRQSGVIASAGPVTNYVLSLVFMILLLVMPTGLPHDVAFFGLVINGWLGLFNLIPFGPFDGRKILTWNKGVYACLVAVGFLFLVLPVIL